MLVIFAFFRFMGSVLTTVKVVMIYLVPDNFPLRVRVSCIGRHRMHNREPPRFVSATSIGAVLPLPTSTLCWHVGLRPPIMYGQICSLMSENRAILGSAPTYCILGALAVMIFSQLQLNDKFSPRDGRA